MAVRDIVYFPDKRLREKSTSIAEINEEIKQLAADMVETMHHYNGIGLAAIQIGVPLRIFIMEINEEENDNTTPPMAIINPEIVSYSQEKSIYKEGCLSIPDCYSEVERPSNIKLQYQDLEGKTHLIELGGLQATCVQHEIDHLDGTLFIDHISKLKRDRIIKKMKNINKQK